MSTAGQLELLSQRRSQLLARAEAQRSELGFYYTQFERPVRQTEAVGGFLNSLRRSPVVLTALAALLLRTPWRKLARIPKLAWRGWTIVQFLRGWKW